MDWDDLKIILAIGRAGTLTGAAKALELNHSTVFRRINSIEKKLDVRFFDRLPNGYLPTDAGETAIQSAEKIDNEFHGLSRELVGKDLRLQGNIRVTAPEGITIQLLVPHIAKFCRIHPDIDIDLAVTGNSLQLSQREADLAIRATTKPPETSIGRKLCKFRFAMYASEEYLSKHKDQGLTEHNWVVTEDSRNWFPTTTWKKIGYQKSRVVIRSNSTMAVVNAAREGLGIAPLPCFLGDSEPGLRRVVEPHKDMKLELWLLTHPDLRNTARVKALMRYLAESFEKQKELIEGNNH